MEKRRGGEKLKLKLKKKIKNETGTTAIVGGNADAGEKENRRAVIRLLFIEHYANRGTRCVYTVYEARRRVSGENPVSFTNERSGRALDEGSGKTAGKKGKTESEFIVHVCDIMYAVLYYYVLLS